MISADPHALAKKPMLDLRLDHVRYEIGDITAQVTWNLHTSEPCLVLTPRRTKLSFETVTPCVVPQSMAWVWDEHTGDGSHCARSAMQFAYILNLNHNSPDELYRITAIIRDMIEDLILCPVLPDHLRVKVADMIVTDNQTGRVTEKEVTDHV